jgi:hypothetical protein
MKHIQKQKALVGDLPLLHKKYIKIYAKCVSKTVSKKPKDIFKKFITVFISTVKMGINFLNVRRLFLKLFLLINFTQF